MSNKWRPCPFCDCSAVYKIPNEPTPELIQCGKCGYTSNAWNENASRTDTTTIPPEALALLPEFDTEKYEYDFNCAVNDDRPFEYYHLVDKVWIHGDFIPALIMRRPKAPAWEVINHECGGVDLIRGDNRIGMSKDEWAELLKLAVDRAGGE